VVGTKLNIYDFIFIILIFSGTAQSNYINETISWHKYYGGRFIAQNVVPISRRGPMFSTSTSLDVALNITRHGFRSFRPQVDSAQVIPAQVDPAPSRSGPKLNVNSAPFEIKYFWTEIHKCLSFQNVFDRFWF
jgi:hypothetical protein